MFCSRLKYQQKATITVSHNGLSLRGETLTLVALGRNILQMDV